MACFHPKPARAVWEKKVGGGYLRRLKFNIEQHEATHWLPCQTCVGCREAQALEWTIRLKHETRSHSHSTFLTLTYADEATNIALDIPELQRFWKRLRKYSSSPIKYFACGEYGDRTKRPHYHAAVFNLGTMPDAKKWDMENTVSETLNGIWKNGRVLQSELTPPRIAYVTGYVMKKAGYKKQIYCDEDGVDIQAPFRKMSNGLGKQWLEKYATDLREGCVQHEDYKIAIPRYYLEKLKKDRPHLAEIINKAKDERRQAMQAPDRDRLDAAEQIRHQLIKKHKRDKL